jgi:hypothetical protein
MSKIVQLKTADQIFHPILPEKLMKKLPGTLKSDCGMRVGGLLSVFLI